MPDSGSFDIVDFEPRHATAFRDLNLAWIEAYFEVEEPDRQILFNPQQSIIKSGGAIRVVEAGNEIVAVCALKYLSPGQYEITKMAVREDMRGSGIGRQLMADVITHARKLGACRLRIISNTILKTALHLYRTFGFVEVDKPIQRQYSRGNIELQLDLAQQ